MSNHKDNGEICRLVNSNNITIHTQAFMNDADCSKGHTSLGVNALSPPPWELKQCHKRRCACRGSLTHTHTHARAHRGEASFHLHTIGARLLMRAVVCVCVCVPLTPSAASHRAQYEPLWPVLCPRWGFVKDVRVGVIRVEEEGWRG